jgi:hypothetical protein
MRFLAFPIAGLGILVLWAAGADIGVALALGPLLALFLFGILLPLLWPTEPRRKEQHYVRIPQTRKRSPSEPSPPPGPSP